MANMLKKIKKGQRKKPPAIAGDVAHSWLDEDGFHVFGPGRAPTAEEYEEMTRIYREKIRSSPLWTRMVKQYGKKKAEEILLECKVKPG
jgi:hypothetical protein